MHTHTHTSPQPHVKFFEDNTKIYIYHSMAPFVARNAAAPSFFIVVLENLSKKCYILLSRYNKSVFADYLNNVASSSFDDEAWRTLFLPTRINSVKGCGAKDDAFLPFSESLQFCDLSNSWLTVHCRIHRFYIFLYRSLCFKRVNLYACICYIVPVKILSNDLISSS